MANRDGDKSGHHGKYIVRRMRTGSRQTIRNRNQECRQIERIKQERDRDECVARLLARARR